MSKKRIPDEVRAQVETIVEQFNKEERAFPGSGHVDGTVAGAMRAGLKAYPV